MPGQLCHEEDGNPCLHNGSLVLKWAKSGKRNKIEDKHKHTRRHMPKVSMNPTKKQKKHTHTDTHTHTHLHTHTHVPTHTYTETYPGGCGTRNEALLK